MKSLKHIQKELIQGYLAVQAKRGFDRETIEQMKGQLENYDMWKKITLIFNAPCALMTVGPILVIFGTGASISGILFARCLGLFMFGLFLWGFGRLALELKTQVGDQLLKDYSRLDETLAKNALPSLSKPYADVRSAIENKLREIAMKDKWLDGAAGEPALQKEELKLAYGYLYDDSNTFRLVAGDPGYYYEEE